MFPAPVLGTPQPMRRWSPFAVATAVVLLAPAPGALADTFYAAPGGSGSSCTLAQPCSLDGARDRVRQVNTPGNPHDIVVYLRGGTYELSTAFRLEGQDSGKDGYTVTYAAYPGETPVLSGGRQITGWTPVGGTTYYVASRPAGSSNRNLYVDGVRAVRARGPIAPPGFHETATGYMAPDASMNGWHVQNQMEVVSFVHWKAFRCGIQSVVGQAVTIYEPCWTDSHPNPPPHPNQIFNIGLPRWIENALPHLDDEGEAVFQGPPPGAGTVYYKPRAVENLAGAVTIVPAVETLLLLDGTASAPLRNLQFRGITFSYTDWKRPSTAPGYPATQAGFYADSGRSRRPPAAVVARFARQVRFERNVFSHLGGIGLTLEPGVQDSVFIGNRFEDISSTAVMVGDVGPDGTSMIPTHILRNIVLRSNFITRAGAEFQDAVGIFASYPERLVLLHNELFDLPYTGIEVGWTGGFGDTLPGDPDPVPLRENRIEANLVSHYVQTLRDGGGIYFQRPQPDTKILRNHVHTHARDWAGFYLDNLTGELEVTRNVVTDTPFWLMLQIARCWPAEDNTVHTNYVDVPTAWNDVNGWCEPVSQPDYCPGRPCPVNQVSTGITKPNWPQDAYDVIAAAGLEAAYRDIRPWNVALGKPTATTPHGDPAPQGNDGSAVTGWTPAPGDPLPQWHVDLKAPHRLQDVELVARHPFAFDQPLTRQNFHVQASNASNFATGTVTVGTRGATPFDAFDIWQPGPMPAGHFRYLRTFKSPVPPTDFFVADFRVLTRRSVAEGKPTLASSTLDAYLPGNAVNGNADDTWSPVYGVCPPSCPPDPMPWWQVDLGAAHFLHGAEIVAWNNPSFDHPAPRRYFTVLASNDPNFGAGTYVTIGTQGDVGPNFPHLGVWSSPPFVSSLPYRYVRIAKTVPDYFLLSDVRVFGVEAPTPANLAAAGVATASSQWDANFGPAKANDGSTATGWSPSASDTQRWWRVDLGSPMRIESVELVSRQDIDQPETRRNFQVEVSNDPLFVAFGVLGSQGGTSFPHQGTWTGSWSSPQSFRYVRVRKLVSEIFFIAELRVWGRP
jgi:hypothetical protein